MSRLSEQLKSLGAYDEFARAYESLSDAWGECRRLNWKEWLVRSLAGRAEAEYKRVQGTAWAKYASATNLAWAEYERACNEGLDRLFPQIEAEFDAKFKGGPL